MQSIKLDKCTLQQDSAGHWVIGNLDILFNNGKLHHFCVLEDVTVCYYDGYVLVTGTNVSHRQKSNFRLMTHEFFLITDIGDDNV